MALRTFRGEDGADWQVWDVIPQGPTRHERSPIDRRSPDPILRYTGPERRSGVDRRGSAEFVNPALRRGWLTFQSATEKRRLAPIPPGWESLPNPRLEELRALARPVPRLRP